MQNFYFHFGHGDWVWVDAEKMMKKLLLPPDIRSEKIKYGRPWTENKAKNSQKIY